MDKNKEKDRPANMEEDVQKLKGQVSRLRMLVFFLFVYVFILFDNAFAIWDSIGRLTDIVKVLLNDEAIIIKILEMLQEILGRLFWIMNSWRNIA